MVADLHSGRATAKQSSLQQELTKPQTASPRSQPKGTFPPAVSTAALRTQESFQSSTVFLTLDKPACYHTTHACSTVPSSSAQLFSPGRYMSGRITFCTRFSDSLLSFSTKVNKVNKTPTGYQQAFILHSSLSHIKIAVKEPATRSSTFGLPALPFA